jgi:hypothetical protein
MECLVKSFGMGVLLISNTNGELLTYEKVKEIAIQFGELSGIWADPQVSNVYVVLMLEGLEPSFMEAEIMNSEDGVTLRRIISDHNDPQLNGRLEMLDNVLNKLETHDGKPS